MNFAFKFHCELLHFMCSIFMDSANHQKFTTAKISRLRVATYIAIKSKQTRIKKEVGIYVIYKK